MRRIRTMAALLVAVAGLGLACGDGDATGDSDDGSTDTTAESTASPSTTGPVEEPAEGIAIWPPAGEDTSYDDPVRAAADFATELVGFSDPIVGELRRGDARSGEVEVRSRPDGPVTTVFVRQLAEQDWSVIGAATANIVLESPGTLEEISSPVSLAGQATAFEGTVQTAVADASGERLGDGFVTGGTFGELGPFDGQLEFAEPDGGTGAVVLYTVSARDGTVEEATAIAVRFPTG